MAVELQQERGYDELPEPEIHFHDKHLPDGGATAV